MAAKSTLYKSKASHVVRGRSKVKYEPAYSVKEICAMYGLTHHRFAGLLSQHPLQAALNVGGGQGKAVYPLSKVLAWASQLGLEKVK